MLRLPSNWRTVTAYATVCRFLKQAQESGVYGQCSSLLVHACLELLIEGWGKHKPQPPVAVELDRDGFRLGRSLFHNCCDVNDSSLEYWPRLSRRRLRVTMLVPPWLSTVASTCAAQVAPRIDVRSVAEYVELRVFFTSMDLKTDFEETFSMLLDWYVRLNEESGTEATAIEGLSPGGATNHQH